MQKVKATDGAEIVLLESEPVEVAALTEISAIDAVASSEALLVYGARSIGISGASPMAEVALRDVDELVLSSGGVNASGGLVVDAFVFSVYLDVIDKATCKVLIKKFV